jgi:WD40 repeat protein
LLVSINPYSPMVFREMKTDATIHKAHMGPAIEAKHFSQKQNDVAISPDGNWIAVAGKSPALTIFKINLENNQIIEPRIFAPDNIEEIKEIEFNSESDKIFFTTAKNGFGTLEKGENWRLHQYQIIQPKWFIDFCKISDGHVFFKNDKKELEYTKINDEQFSSPKFITNLKDGKVTAIALCEKKNRPLLAVGYEDGTIGLWESSNRGNDWEQKILEEKGEDYFFHHTAKISALKFSENGEKLAAASFDGSASVIFFKEKNYPTYVFDDIGNWAISIDFVGDDQQVMVGSKNGDLLFYHLDMKKYFDALKKIEDQ